MHRSIILKRLSMLLFLMSSLISVCVASVEYLTLSVGGNPVVIVLSEHPVITYTDNSLHIQTAKETIDVPVSQLSGATFSETTDIKAIEEYQIENKAGIISFQKLPRGSRVLVFAANGIAISSATADDYGQAVIHIADLPKGIFVVKSATQTLKITNN
ncbi:MAG: hypothetical protein IJ533_02865 [Prevotella sp.]|nr:hypothetical protein [Prevotella sp.]